MKLSLFKGLPGHPLHPLLTDPTIGIYTGAAAFARRAVAPVPHPEKEAAEGARSGPPESER
jgi:hypothetical protein